MVSYYRLVFTRIIIAIAIAIAIVVVVVVIILKHNEAQESGTFFAAPDSNPQLRVGKI